MTFRLRLTLWYSALVMSIITIFGISVYLILQRTMRTQVDNNLTQVVNEVEQSMSGFVFVVDGVPSTFTLTMPLNTVRTPGTFVQLWRADQDYLLSRSVNASFLTQALDKSALEGDQETWSEVRLQGTNLRVLTRPFKTEDGYTVAYIQAATSLETVEDATTQLFKIMILGSGVALFLAVLLGDWLARRALRPVRQITSTAEQIIKAEDLASRIPSHGPADEIGYLITTLNEMISRLEKLFTAQQRFVADVSHELRTPITAIISHLDLLERYIIKSGDDPSLKAIKSETQRMSRLVGDLLMLAQADFGHLPLIESDVHLDTLLLEVFNEAIVLSKGEQNIVLREIDQVVVRGDSDRLKQVLLNLVTNALKYTPSGGTISLSLSKHKQQAQIKVQDTGIGIPAEDLPHIFDRFYRVDKARARALGGSGLGLAIVKWITEAHHGQIAVESVLEKGTIFTLTLPLKAEAVDLAEANSHKRQKRFLKRPALLETPSQQIIPTGGLDKKG
jgi:heavy metal sensor kinase